MSNLCRIDCFFRSWCGTCHFPNMFHRTNQMLHIPESSRIELLYTIEPNIIGTEHVFEHNHMLNLVWSSHIPGTLAFVKALFAMLSRKQFVTKQIKDGCNELHIRDRDPIFPICTILVLERHVLDVLGCPTKARILEAAGLPKNLVKMRPKRVSNYHGIYV